ncbi:AzlC family ABC transporter permease [Dongshaea marina]|uniref:AzlC family ABC transporter permease n=1 Tax=Dongshaea marina TaxID=2047966 RepID=UPI0018FF7F96|nr:AzlC family ABC transporter permease [Dongshaea marina]
MNMTEMSRKQLFLAGAKGIVPLVIANFPFSFIVGALSISLCGMSVVKSTLMSFFVIAGSAQIVALNLYHEHTAIVIILFTTFIINLRHILYSAAMSPLMKGYSFFTRVIMSWALTDEVFATNVTPMKENQKDPRRIYFYFGVMFTFWFFWVLANLLGALLGSSFPNIGHYGLDFAMVASFVAIVVPQLRNSPMVIAAVAAGICALVFHNLPYNLGLVIASLVGIAAGYISSTLLERQQLTEEAAL